MDAKTQSLLLPHANPNCQRPVNACCPQPTLRIVTRTRLLATRCPTAKTITRTWLPYNSTRCPTCLLLVVDLLLKTNNAANFISQSSCIDHQNEHFHTSTNTPIQCPTNACTQQAGPIRTLSPHRSFHPTPHPPALQSTHQCPCTHNALHNRPSNNARPAQFKPCHTNTPHHRRVNTKPNP